MNIVSLNSKKTMNDYDEMLEIIEKLKIETGESSYQIPNLPRSIFMDLRKVVRNPINRDERRRLRKVTFLKEHNRTHDEIALFVVRETLYITTSDNSIYTILPNVYLGNGNTRRLFYTENPKSEPKTETLMATVHEVTSGEDYELLYNSYDSSNSVEISSEKIQGAISFLKLNVNSAKVKSGAIGSALSMAYGDWSASAKDRVSTFREEIELLDKVGIFSPAEKGPMGFQVMYALGLMVAKLYNSPAKSNERMISGLQILANSKADSMDYSDTKWDGLTAICHETFNPGKKNWIPQGMLGATNMASQAPQLDFMLYCFEKYMTAQKLDKAKGFKPANWKGKWNEVAEILDRQFV
jgi:hypothetical protein